MTKGLYKNQNYVEKYIKYVEYGNKYILRYFQKFSSY